MAPFPLRALERPSQSRSLVHVRRRPAFSAILAHGRGVERCHPRVPVLHPGQLPRQVAGGGPLAPRHNLPVPPPHRPPLQARAGAPPARSAAAGRPPPPPLRAPPPAAAARRGPTD